MIRLSEEHWQRIRKHFPGEHIADGHPGRKPVSRRGACSKQSCGFNTGAQWHMLPQSYPNYKTVHRRFQSWCHSEVLRQALTDVANVCAQKGAGRRRELHRRDLCDGQGGGAEIGPTKRGKGMKIMAIVDRHGLPLSVSTHAANHHEVRLVQLCFDFYMIEAKPETLIGIAPMIATRSMTIYAKTASRWSRRTDPIAASAPRKMDDGFGDTPGAGWLNASSPGSSAPLVAGAIREMGSSYSTLCQYGKG